jgi:hypothetical protein
MRDTRLGEVLEAKMHLRICDLRVLCAATTLETARLVAHHGGWKKFKQNLREGRWSGAAGFAALNRAAATAARQPIAIPLWPPSKR